MSSNIKSRHTGKALVLASPITGAFAITPHDSNDLTEVTLNLFVGTAGTAKLTMFDGSVVEYATLNAGRHPLRVKRVWATGTTATGRHTACAVNLPQKDLAVVAFAWTTKAVCSTPSWAVDFPSND